VGIFDFLAGRLGPAGHWIWRRLDVAAGGSSTDGAQPPSFYQPREIPLERTARQSWVRRYKLLDGESFRLALDEGNQLFEHGCRDTTGHGIS
jgi:hypothetical protein